MTHDPYAVPGVAPDRLEHPAAPRDLRWRGVAWFLVPLLGLLFAVFALEIVDRKMTVDLELVTIFSVTIILLVPSGGIGYLSGRRLRTQSWWPYLLLTTRDGLTWAILAAMVILAYNHWYLSGFLDWQVVAERTTRMAIVMPALALLLATTMRLYYRRRP